MTKSKKQRDIGFWTVSRCRMVETMQALRVSDVRIADALGCRLEVVQDFLMGQVDGTGPPPVSDRLFFMVERVAAMATYQVTVQPKGNDKAREWAGEAASKDEAEDCVTFLAPKLPEGLEATQAEGVRDPAMPLFDFSRLRERPNEPKEDVA